MNKKTKEKGKGNIPSYWVDFAIKSLIAPLIIGVILLFFKINDLQNKIEIQNSVIQSNKVEIQKLESNVTTLNITVQQQSTLINSLQNTGVIAKDNANIEQLNQHSGGTLTIGENRGIAGYEQTFKKEVNLNNK